MAKTKSMPKSLKLPVEAPGCLAVSPNGVHLVVSEGTSFDGRLWHIDGVTGEVTALASVAGMITSLAVADDGRVAIAFHSQACDRYKSSGEGSAGGAWVELRDGAEHTLHSVELELPYAAISWGQGDLLAVRHDGMYQRHPVLVGLIDAGTGRLVRAAFEGVAPSAGMTASACFVNRGTELLAVVDLVDAWMTLRIAADGAVTSLGTWSYPAVPSALVPLGADRILAIHCGGRGWRLLDAEGRSIAAGDQGAMTGCADGEGDGFVVASGRQLVRFGADGVLRETLKLKVPVAAVAAGGGRAFGLGRGTLLQLS
jgi:hypothetical protein